MDSHVKHILREIWAGKPTGALVHRAGLLMDACHKVLHVVQVKNADKPAAVLRLFMDGAFVILVGHSISGAVSPMG